MPVSTPQSQFEREAELHRSMRRLKVISTSERQLVFGRLDLEDSAGPRVRRPRRSLRRAPQPDPGRLAGAGRLDVLPGHRAANRAGWSAGERWSPGAGRSTELNDDLLIPEKAKRLPGRRRRGRPAPLAPARARRVHAGHPGHDPGRAGRDHPRRSQGEHRPDRRPGDGEVRGRSASHGVPDVRARRGARAARASCSSGRRRGSAATSAGSFPRSARPPCRSARCST